MVAGRSLNVAYLYGAYEDSKSVMLVMELCKGGELWKRVRSTRYSEKGASCPACLALCLPLLICLHLSFSWKRKDRKTEDDAVRQFYVEKLEVPPSFPME